MTRIQERLPDYGRTGTGYTPRQSADFALQQLRLQLATAIVLRYMRDMAVELKMTQTISLIPTLTNPKNLFGFVADNRDAQGPGLAA